MTKVLVTGGAGFVGSHLVDLLLDEGCEVTVIDNFDPLYSRAQKEANIAAHLANPAYRFLHADIRDRETLVERLPPGLDVVVHLAAKAGVRPSMEAPADYHDVNVNGLQNMLDVTRQIGIERFVFASSSSVYGVNPRVPWCEDDRQVLPISPYASTKLLGEIVGRLYASLYNFRFVALRLFTVYGPRQRPDLAIHKFATRLLSGQPLQVYGDGTTMRDYTYVGDAVRGIRAAMDYSLSSFDVFNIASGRPIRLLDLVSALEEAMGIRANVVSTAEQPGDVHQTFASIQKARDLLGYCPAVTLRIGLDRFLEWLKAASGAETPGRQLVQHAGRSVAE